MLKRTLCAAFAVAVLVAFSVPAFAGSHHKMRVRGTVESVDPTQKTFVVKDRDGKAIPFRVDDRSEFELEHRDKPDQDVPFTELKTGDRVKTGDLLIEFDMYGISGAGYQVITPVVVCNSAAFSQIETFTGKHAGELEELIRLRK